MSALHPILRDRLHHAENAVEAAQRAYRMAVEEAREAGIDVPESTVTVPVSLIKRLVHGDGPFPMGELLALLAQQTLSGNDEQRKPGEGEVAYFHRTGRDPDMAPGTTFSAATPDGYGRWQWVVLSDGRVRLDGTTEIWYPNAIDPSTIRDVTPPTDKETNA